MELIFATNNSHKLEEIKKILNDSINLKNLSDINCFEDIPETGETLEENAFLKSNYVYQKFNVNCFADDTGLEIEALNGEPGVYSARYAGDNNDASKNMQKVLDNLKSIKNRNARFRTVISLIINGKEFQFEGIANGTIENHPSGMKGFGYDPIFTPLGYNDTFAEMSSSCKNKISHRAIATRKLVNFLNQNNFTTH